MQACQHGHWEVVQTLTIFKANVRSGYQPILLHVLLTIR